MKRLEKKDIKPGMLFVIKYRELNFYDLILKTDDKICARSLFINSNGLSKIGNIDYQYYINRVNFEKNGKVYYREQNK